jgi:hypothetical protein
MSTNVADPVEETATAMVGGILGDFTHLVEQQFRLTRLEIQEQLRQRASAAAPLALGVGVLFLGAIMLSLTLVHLLHRVTSHAGADPASIPLWACYAIITALLLAGGSTLAVIGQARFKMIGPFRYPASENVKENVS